MALHNATERTVLLVVRARKDSVHVPVRGLVRPRVDLAPLAALLNDRETGTGQWTSTPPSDLTPELYLVDDVESSLDPDVVARTLRQHLLTAVPAWDPWSRR
jgi:hypothetical protein